MRTTSPSRRTRISPLGESPETTFPKRSSVPLAPEMAHSRYQQKEYRQHLSVIFPFTMHCFSLEMNPIPPCSCTQKFHAAMGSPADITSSR